jgi:hypothetical protein
MKNLDNRIKILANAKRYQLHEVNYNLDEEGRVKDWDTWYLHEFEGHEIFNYQLMFDNNYDQPIMETIKTLEEAIALKNQIIAKIIETGAEVDENNISDFLNKNKLI